MKNHLTRNRQINKGQLRNFVLEAEIYPDSDDFENSENILVNGLDNVADRVEFTYNRISERKTKMDQNGTAHTYEYDNHGRILHDRVTTLAAEIDGSVRRISTTYTLTGQTKTLTSYDNSSTSYGNAVSQIAYEYDDCGLLSKEFSNPDGAVTTETPWIGYLYDKAKDEDCFVNSLRQISLRYPSGKLIEYRHDNIGRPVSISEGENDIVTYEYQGLSSPIKTTYTEPQLNLDYTTSGALDRFARITDHAWKNELGEDIVRIKHSYDRSGNRTHREDTAAKSHNKSSTSCTPMTT